MRKNIFLSDIDFGKEEVEAVNRVLKSKWLSMGPVTEKFEDRFKKYLNIKNAYAVNNCTAALHIAHKVLGIKEGDEVICPSLTFVATANSILYCGAKPVFADITSLDDFNISPDDILKKITKKTKAITVVHYAGYPCDMDAIMKIAKDHKLYVIEDAAHAPGTEYKGKKAGTIGDIGCFSFFANKNIVTGEGGMIVTNNDAFSEKINSLRCSGMTAHTWNRHKVYARGYDIIDLGFNYCGNEITSSIGMAQLNKLNKNNNKRKKIVDLYKKELKNIKEITIPFKDFKEKSSYHIMPILLSGEVLRNKFMDKLKVKGIQTSIHYTPIHLFSYYKKRFGLKEGYLPITEFVGRHEVTLPLHPLLSFKEVRFVVNNVARSIGSAK
ncbi:MAG: DegT/DnrJ/EryC1/StrS family aminotransferase [Candidatus Omnitrophica bacterium]|nr:DegT/DnrJ/EryC1/StrS family aminotransferase [Candidatus Omnitrophota bacterium]